MFGIKNYNLFKKSKKIKRKKEKIVIKRKEYSSNLDIIKIRKNKIKKNRIKKHEFSNKNNINKSDTSFLNKKKNIKNIKRDIININKFPTGNGKNKIISIKKRDIIQKIYTIMKYNEQELNELNYKSALKCDKRNYCEYYFSLIKTKHDLIFAFCYNDDYNSKIIKIKHITLH